jgi:hypothetical protein
MRRSACHSWAAVRERGMAVRVDGQAHHGIPEVTGADGGQLGHCGQPQPGRADVSEP